MQKSLNQKLEHLYMTKQKERQLPQLSIQDKIDILETEMGGGGVWTYSSFNIGDELDESDELELRLAMLEDQYLVEKGSPSERIALMY